MFEIWIYLYLPCNFIHTFLEASLSKDIQADLKGPSVRTDAGGLSFGVRVSWNHELSWFYGQHSEGRSNRKIPGLLWVVSNHRNTMLLVKKTDSCFVCGHWCLKSWKPLLSPEELWTDCECIWHDNGAWLQNTRFSFFSIFFLFLFWGRGMCLIINFKSNPCTLHLNNVCLCVSSSKTLFHLRFDLLQERTKRIPAPRGVRRNSDVG